jgi:hypothetical protein
MTPSATLEMDDQFASIMLLTDLQKLQDGKLHRYNGLLLNVG